MSIVAVGGAVTAVGALAAMYLCGRGRGAANTSELKEVVAGAVVHLDSKPALQALLASGGKAVVYLTATW